MAVLFLFNSLFQCKIHGLVGYYDHHHMAYPYWIKGKIFRACVQSVLTYGTETWAVKAENLRSLERAECMMVR